MTSFRRKDTDDHEDDFWNASKVRQTTGTFNLFSDDVSVDSARTLAHKFIGPHDDDEEDEEEIKWDGTPVETSSISHKSARFHPPPSKSSNTATALPPNSSARMNSSASIHNTSQNYGTGSSVEVDDSFVKFKPASVKNKLKSTEPNIQDVVTANIADIAKKETNVAVLRSRIEELEADKWQKPPINDTLNQMINGERFSLEMYKSKEDKLALLDKSIALHDGNSILAAILFLKTTAKAQIFNIELMQRPEAVNHYISYLKERGKLKELEDMLNVLGKREEAAMLKYKLATSTTDAGVKLNHLKTCYTSYFQGYPSLAHDGSLLQQQIDLLDRQRPIDEEDIRLTEEKRHVLLRDYPRKTNVVNQPLITTLYYCCFYHYDLPESSRVSPLSLKKHFQLTDKQYLTIALRARSKLKRWREIEDLLTAKGWFGTTKMKSPIGFDKVTEILHKEGATKDVIEKYLNLIDDIDKRLVLAKKMKCNRVVVNTLVSLRDRSQLENYMQTLKPHTEEQYYVRDALANSATKWKT